MKVLAIATMTTVALLAAAINAAAATTHSDEINSYALLLTDASMAETDCGYTFNIPEMSHVSADLHIQRPQDQKDINAAELHWTQIETESLKKDKGAWCAIVWNRFGPAGTTMPMVLIQRDQSERPAQ